MLSRKAFFSAFTLFVLAISLILPQPASVSAAPAHFPGGVVFVKSDATGANDGTSWANAYTALQPGINAAEAGDEVWVVAGSYSPGALATDSFVMKEGVKIYGGFAGTETVHLDVTCQALEAALHFGFQLIHGHVDIQAPDQSFENFKICLHQNTS